MSVGRHTTTLPPFAGRWWWAAAVLLVFATGARLDAQPTEPSAQQPRYFTREFTLEQFELSRIPQWLSRIGVQLPFTVEGELNADLKVGVPITAFANGRLYRFQGTADSPRLVIDGLAMLDVSARARYAEGVLELEELRLLVPAQPGNRKTAGTVEGQARLEVVPSGDLTAQLRLERTPLGPLLNVFPDLQGRAQGRLTGSAEARVAADKLRAISGWNIQGNLTLDDFQAQGLAVEQATAEAQLADAELTLASFRAKSVGGNLAGRGSLKLNGTRPFSTEFDLADGNLGRLATILFEGEPPVEIEGRTTASLEAQGTLAPVRVEGRGSFSVRDARFDDLTIRSLELPLDFTGEQLRIEGARAELSGGRLSGDAEIALAQRASSRAALRWERIELEPLARLLARLDILPRQGTVEGAASGQLEVRIPSGALRAPAAWSGQGELTIENLVAFAVDFARAEVNANLDNGSLRITRLAATDRQERLSAGGEVRVAAPFAFTTAVDWKNGELRSLPPAIAGRGLPTVQLGGRFDLSANLHGELQPRSIRGDLSLDARDVRYDDVRLGEAAIRASLDRRQAELQELLLRLYRGEVRGTATIRWGGGEPGKAALSWRQLDVASLLRDLTGYPAEPGSASRGQFTAVLPADAPLDFRKWQVEGSGSVENFRAFDEAVETASLDFALSERVAKVSSFSLETKSGALNGSAQIDVDAPYDFQARLNARRFNLAVAGSATAYSLGLPVQTGGLLTLDAEISGKLTPLEIEGGGSASGQDVQVGALVLESVAFDYRFGEQRLNIENLQGRLYDGTAEGSAQLPLRAEGTARASLAWRDVGIGKLINAFLEQTPLSLSGAFDGSAVAESLPGRLGDPSGWTAKASFTASKLMSHEQEAGEITGSATLEAGVLDYRASGSFLGGPLQLSGTWPISGASAQDESGPENRQDRSGGARKKTPAAPHSTEARQEQAAGGQEVAFRQPVQDAGNQGELKWSEVTLARLRGLLPEGELPEALDATASLDLQYEHQGTALSGNGELLLEALSWGGTSLSERLQGRVELSEKDIRLTGFRGRYADGLAQLNAAIPLRSSADIVFELLLNRARFSPALSPFLPLGDVVDSRLDLRLKGQFGAQWRLSGGGVLTQTEIAGIPAGKWRLPLLISYDPATGRATYTFRRVLGDLAHGRVTGDAKIVSGNRLRIEGALKFNRLDLDELLQDLGYSQYGSGRISGTVSFGGRNIRELRDLSATFDARLEDTASDVVPILGPLQPHMPAVLPSTTFRQGQLRGRLQQETLLIERLSLANPTAEVYATGQVTLAGRLNLEVTAGTDRLRRGRAARILLRSLLVVSQPELALLMRASNFLADQVIHVKVTGTMTSPVIRVRALQLLSEEALRFFLAGGAG